MKRIMEEVILKANRVLADGEVKEKKLFLSGRKFDKLKDSMKHLIVRFYDQKLLKRGIDHVMIQGIPVVRE